MQYGSAKIRKGNRSKGLSIMRNSSEGTQRLNKLAVNCKARAGDLDQLVMLFLYEARFDPPETFRTSHGNARKPYGGKHLSIGKGFSLSRRLMSSPSQRDQSPSPSPRDNSPSPSR